MDWVLVLAGLGLLVFAGDALVRGAVNLALRLGIPAFVVSVTIVAFGTSAPELLISTEAVLNGVPGLALGNVIGSNIANVLLVLGLPALLRPLTTSDIDTRASYLQMIAATALIIALLLVAPLDWRGGILLLAGLAAMITLAVKRGRNSPEDADVEGADPALASGRITILLALGLVGLPLGASLLIDGATGIAQSWGVSETVIGLTLVAVGTSLPELATTIAAALRRQADVALGNVIGSNLFNILGILGVASMFGSIPAGAETVTRDLPVMAAAALILVPFVFFRQAIGRLWGFVLVALYAVYLWSLI